MTAERLDRFMARANAAYYADHDPFADFTTAPEISQMFGELLGAWAAEVWRLMGAPAALCLAEAGPGRGTLMADALRLIRRVRPALAAALELHLVESSPRLRDAQRAALPDARFHDRVETLPPLPLLLLANEFLDALPIRQFVRRGAGWTERFVADGVFEEHGCAGEDAPAGTAAEGAVVEHGAAGHAFVAAVAGHVARAGGAALLLDYGPAASAPGDSLQALRHGAPADPLAGPGGADLTAHVDFAALAATARAGGAAVYGPVPQGLLLERLGLFVRAGRLAAGLAPRAAGLVMQQAQRLAAPERMGALFKALAICHPALPTPPGFSA